LIYSFKHLMFAFHIFDADFMVVDDGSM